DARVKAMYDFTCQLATLEPPPPEMQQLFAAIPGDRRAMDGFAQMSAGTISPAAFFAPENVEAITAAARRRAVWRRSAARGAAGNNVWPTRRPRRANPPMPSRACAPALLLPIRTLGRVSHLH